MKKGKRWVQVAGAIIGTFLISYLVTLFFGKRVDSLSQNEFYSGKTVILQETGLTIDVEEYLVMVVAAQIPASWPEEVLNAQAILARTFIYRRMGQEKSISDTALNLEVYSISQMETVWGKKRFEKYYNRIRSAVENTLGQFIAYEGEPIEVLYHYASCGTTRADTTGYYPYFQAVESQWDLNVSGYLQNITMTEKEFIEKIRLLDNSEQIGGENIASFIQITKKDTVGYVEQVLIEGKSFTGAEVTEVLGVTSTCFTIEGTDSGISVTARGIGHGYGMSQWGAKCMAEEGKSAKEILEYYYVGCEVKKV